MYDITRKLTFQNVQRWLIELRNHTDDDVKITLGWLTADKLDFCYNYSTTEHVF